MTQTDSEAKLAAVCSFFEPHLWDTLTGYQRLQCANLYNHYITMLEYGLPSKPPHFVLAYCRRKQETEKLIQEKTNIPISAGVFEPVKPSDIPVGYKHTDTSTLAQASTTPSSSSQKKLHPNDSGPSQRVLSRSAPGKHKAKSPKKRAQPKHKKQSVSAEKKDARSSGLRCGKPSVLKAHAKTKQTTVSGHQCHICLKCFTQSQNVKRHVTAVHHHAEPFQCQKCKKGFVVKGSLDRHLKYIHGGGRKFECEECGKKFGNESNLKRHKHIHQGQKAHVCEICAKAFEGAGQLATHRRSHLQFLVP